MQLRTGNSIWNEFKSVTELDYSPDGIVALFDHHDVVDTLNYDEACDVGVSLDHIEDANTYLCSFGKSHRQNVLNPYAAWAPMIEDMDGCLFTDYRANPYNWVHVYREPWMPARFVSVSGDKGQVARLMGKPTLLFDDKVDNLNTLHSRAGRHEVRGILVRRGRLAASASSRRFRMDPFARQYLMANDCNHWPSIVRRFSEDVRNAHAF